MDSKFWNNIYETKAEDAVSWYQEAPTHSLETILSLNLPTDAEIIDVGGGKSKLSEFLHEKAFRNLTVLDISEIVLSKLKEELNKKHPSNQITTISSNIVETHFSKQFDVWHDRAVFHFLTNADDQIKYVDILANALKANGYFLIYTFSKTGPKKCGGLEICQYEKEDLVTKFSNLKLVKSEEVAHLTPFGTIQNFTYCLFKK